MCAKHSSVTTELLRPSPCGVQGQNERYPNVSSLLFSRSSALSYSKHSSFLSMMAMIMFHLRDYRQRDIYTESISNFH